ncbi:MAG: chromosomal replication initiator protein DnaA [Candidatus Moranbacteria bacterium]|nr:chromosomal replication initiator protein DnaA [Candidatus Moranbacteria bacterium]
MKNIWFEAVSKISQDIGLQNVKTWIEPLIYKKYQDNSLFLEAPNKFIKDWFQDNYRKKLERKLNELTDKQIKIEIEINKNKQKIKENIELIINKEENKEEIKNINIDKKTNNTDNSNINNRYTFDTFVSGSSNQFAHAAAMAVANNPATTYNPLFIYGGVGLGKTHIIHSIGNEIIKKSKNLKVTYYSSEKFTNELINSLRHGKMEEFRNKFRSIDVLLIDDIQFIAGKKSTQEEFFHTFNALYESHKQIVVTSDKFPKEIPDLEERLRSRFEWGLIADIQEPDTETKQAILKMKSEINNIDVPEDVIFFLASSITSNVRELEGYLIRIGAYSSLTSTPINIDMAKDVLKNIITENNKEITVDRIQKTIAEYYQIKTSDIKSQKRLKNIVLPRQIAMYISRNMTNLSYPEIGDRFGGKDHSTIIHAIKKIEEKMTKDMSLKMTVDKLMDKLLN